MLRMMLLGLLIPLGVGASAAMELKTPARSAAVPVRPVAEIAAGISEPRGALARLIDLKGVIDLKWPLRASRHERSLLSSTNAILRRKAPVSVHRSRRGWSTSIGTIPSRRRSPPPLLSEVEAKESRGQANHNYRTAKGCRQHRTLPAERVWWLA